MLGVTCSGLHGACSSWCAAHTQQGTPSSAEALQAQWCRRAEPADMVWSLVLPQGDAGQLIVDIAQKEGADILVLGVCICLGVSTPAPCCPSSSRHAQRHCSVPSFLAASCAAGPMHRSHAWYLLWSFLQPPEGATP